MPFVILMSRRHLDKTTLLMFPKRVILKRENSSSPFPQWPHFEDPTAPQFSYCITPCETHIKIYNLLTFSTSDTPKPQHHVVLQHVINVATSLITQSHQDQQPMLIYTPHLTHQQSLQKVTNTYLTTLPIANLPPFVHTNPLSVITTRTLVLIISINLPLLQTSTNNMFCIHILCVLIIRCAFCIMISPSFGNHKLSAARCYDVGSVSI